MDEGSWLSWFIVAALVLASAYFSAAETAFSSVSRIKLKAELDRGDRRAKKALHILDNFEKSIATILIAINIAQLSAAAIVTVLAVRTWGVSAVAVSTVAVALVTFLFGEMLPKSVAKKYSCRFSLAFSSSLYFFTLVLLPLSHVLIRLGTFAAGLAKRGAEITVTEDELYDIIENITDTGELGPSHGDLVYSALEFSDITAESILTPRVDIAAIDIEMPLSEVLALIKSSKHSRFPVYSGSIDHVVGTLQMRKFIKAYIKHGDGLDLNAVMDGAHFVHQSAKIDELLSAMKAKKLNMAVVSDNYGGTLGLVTVEDILEKLVGDIWDEEDEVKTFCVPVGDGIYELDPELTVEDGFELMGFDDPENFDFEHKLLSEWVYEHFDQIPSAGDSFVYNGLTVTVSEMRRNRIVKLLCAFSPEGAEGDEGGRRR